MKAIIIKMIIDSVIDTAYNYDWWLSNEKML